MALFNKKTEKKQDTKAEAPAKSSAPAKKAASGIAGARNLTHILLHARITEKATMEAEKGVYTFDISDSATKNEVKEAVHALYKVTPRLVRILSVPKKVRRNMRTGKVGISRGGRKAYVYLKKGETITIS